MLKDIRKYLEYSFFVLLNISLLAPMLKVYNFLFTVFSVKLAIMFFHMDSNVFANVNSLKEFYDIADYNPFVFCTTTIFCFFLIIVKPFIFPLLYLCKIQLPYIYNFLNTIFINKKFMIIVLIISLSLDIIGILYFNYILSLFLGLFLNYIIFIIFLSIIKKVNKGKNL